MQALADFIVISFAVWGISFGLVHRNGAFDVMKRLREWSLQYAWSPLFCIYCTGFWVAMVLCWLTTYSWTEFVIFWFATTGGAWLIDSISEKLIANTESEMLIRKGH